MPSVADKRRAFRALHASGCFVIPNPWDVGSARYLQHLGFKALATTSAGAAWAAGYADGALPRDAMLAHIAAVASASDLPVNADFGNAFADDPEGVSANVRACVATGVAGLSVEDQMTGVDRLYDEALAAERVTAARRAIDGAGGDTLLVARTECYLTGAANPLSEAIRRLQKFADAGADVLFAPGIRTREDIATLVSEVSPKPVNVLVGWPTDLTVADLAELGVRRISVGGALARAAWAGFITAARDIQTTGRFDAFTSAAAAGNLSGFFQDDGPGRT